MPVESLRVSALKNGEVEQGGTVLSPAWLPGGLALSCVSSPAVTVSRVEGSSAASPVGLGIERPRAQK